MLDRERSPSTGAVAGNSRSTGDQSSSDDSIDEELETRVHRTTIVPQSFGDLEGGVETELGTEFDSELTNQRPALAAEVLAGFELDEPDLDEDSLTQSAIPERDGQSQHARIGSSSTNIHRTVAQLPPQLADLRRSSSPPAALELRKPSHQSQAGRGPASDKWYLRVQLNAECVADLWVRDLTPHNVLVWSEDMETWVPLLTVRELRDAIREAHDTKTRDELRESNFVFVNTNAPAGDTSHRASN
jgi:hypothetical protein